MAAKGTEAKTEIFNKIMQIYPDAFWEDQGKILRIPMSEAGSRVEIKLSLTAAKTNLGGEDVPGAFGSMSSNKNFSIPMPAPEETSLEMTQAEKDNVARLVKELGL